VTALRVLLGVVGVVAFVYAWPALFLIGEFDFGVAIAISAECVLALELLRAIQTDREADRQRMREGRAQVWARRDAACSWPLCSFEPHQCPEARRESA
jgi:hypothetical protein